MKKIFITIIMLLFAFQSFAIDNCNYMKRIVESKWGGMESVRKNIAKYESRADAGGNSYDKGFYHRLNGYKMRLKLFNIYNSKVKSKAKQEWCEIINDANTAIGHYIELAQNLNSFLGYASSKKGEAKKAYDEAVANYFSILELHLELCNDAMKKVDSTIK